MEYRIAPHDVSNGATLLAEKLQTKKILPEGSKYKYKKEHIILNWGSSVKKPWWVEGIKVLNHPDKVAIAVDKIKTFKVLSDAGVSIPEYSSKIEDAKNWIKNGNTVFCRTKVRASGGEGIVVAKTEAELVNCTLYTLYKKKKHEYRIAVVNGVVIDFMQKKKNSEWNVEMNGEVDYLVRSHGRGWIMAREGVNPPQIVLDLAIKSVKSLGLDFASVDIIFNESEGKAYVLELNTAPGLEEGGTSLERYSNAFLALLNQKDIAPAAVIPANQQENQNNNPAPVIATVPVAPVVKKVEVPAVQKTATIKIDQAKDIEIIFHEGKAIVYGKIPGEFYPIKLALIEGQNLNLKKY